MHNSLADATNSVMQNSKMHIEKKRGRPPLSDDTAQIAIKIPQALLARIDSVALDQLCSRSEAVRALLATGLGRPYSTLYRKGS